MQLGNLAKVLADLYPQPADLRRLAAEANMPADAIDFSGSAIQFWYAALERASLSGNIVDLVDIAFFEYPKNDDLRRAAWDYIKDAKTFGRSLNGYFDVSQNSSEMRELMREVYGLSATMKSVEQRLAKMDVHFESRLEKLERDMREIEDQFVARPRVDLTNLHVVAIFTLLTIVAIMLAYLLYGLANGGII